MKVKTDSQLPITFDNWLTTECTQLEQGLYWFNKVVYTRMEAKKVYNQLMKLQANVAHVIGPGVEINLTGRK